jgi:hypothetical protein
VGEVARYVHLNSVRIQGLGLGKAEQRRAAVLGCEDPGEELVARRLRVLRGWPWSSWRAYSGAEPVPKWLEVRTIRGSCGGRSLAEQRRALREYTEAPVRQGTLESPWERLIGGLVLGSEAFAQQILKKGRGNAQEQTAVRLLERNNRPSWGAMIGVAEKLLGQPWEAQLTTHGNWGRDGVLFVAVRYGRHRLPELLKHLPGVRYSAAAQAIQRFGRLVKDDANRSRFVARFRGEIDKMSND